LGPSSLNGEYLTCQVRVRAWKLTDIGHVSFVRDSINIDGTLLNEV